MFRENKKHTQGNLFGFHSTLPKKQQELLEKSEEYKFYELIFCKIQEKDYEVLYSATDSRPNSSVNSLVSSLILMQRYSWTYKELFKNINFNLLTKTALGLSELDDIPFSEATIFNFQNRLANYEMESGVNLLEKTFDNLTSVELKQLKLKTNIQRTDSFFAASNIRNYSRLQLLIEVILRLYRSLSKNDQKYFKESLSSYTTKSSEKYIYDLSSKDLPREIEKIGNLYYRLYEVLKGAYSEEKAFKIFVRVYKEHFKIEDKQVKVKFSEELTSGSLQSPDDIDATYRRKGKIESRGQKISITETANPDNEINLITDVIVKANNVDDSRMLNERLDRIKTKTPDIEELHFDGGYGSKANDEKFEELEIRPVQTAIKGKEAKVKFSIKEVSENEYIVSCPNQEVKSTLGKKRFKSEFIETICSMCSKSEECSATKRKQIRVFYFDRSEYLKQKRIESINQLPKSRRNLRNNVEASVCEFTRKIKNGKLKVRGLFKTSLFAFTNAISINFGRIFRHFSNSIHDGSVEAITLSEANALLMQNIALCNNYIQDKFCFFSLKQHISNFIGCFSRKQAVAF